MTPTITATALDWIEERKAASRLECRAVPLDACSSWRLEDGRIVHRDGAFFSVVGLRTWSSHPALHGLEQPIIHQPEVGILGFLVRRTPDPELLVQAKAEPGNVGVVHLAPTVQATVSNYTCRHGGAATPYLEFFLRPRPPVEVRADSEQSEQGTRFLGKYNRDAMLLVPGDGPEPAGGAWRWLAASTVLDLLAHDFRVNTDARSTLACGDWGLLAPDGEPFGRWRGRGGFGEALLASREAADDEAEASFDDLIDRLAAMRERVSIERGAVSLGALAEWELDDRGLRDRTRERFDVRCFDVSCEGREVSRWDQPLLVGCREEEAVLVAQRRRGRLHFLLRGSAEPGFREAVQLGPSLQTDVPEEDGLALASALAAAPAVEHLAVRQSDEGGRFRETVFRYSVREVPDSEILPADDFSLWATLGQIERMTRRRGVLTNEARSLVSLLLTFL